MGIKLGLLELHLYFLRKVLGEEREQIVTPLVTFPRAFVSQ